MANHVQRLGKGMNPISLGSFCRLYCLCMAQSGRLLLHTWYGFWIMSCLEKDPGKNSVSARLNYLWILRNTHCLRENLRKFVQPPVRKPRSMGRHLQQSGHASEVWCDSDFLLLPQVRTLVYLHPPPISTTLLNRTFHHPVCWCAQAQPIAQMKRKHFKNIWGLNIIFKLIQEVLYICPEFRNSLIWDGSKMKFCIWCNHNIVKAVIPTASSSWQQLKLIPHGTFCAAAAFID